ncbi:hypothetical protein [Nonomuraea sp. NPDC049695]|uniref:hypothetical protein n=1 Tax=Nonomuraea sp. NPDC049695 TaxID=3154734 RepID=UPI00343BE7AD
MGHSANGSFGAPMSGVSFTKHEIGRVGTKFEDQTGTLDDLQGASNNMQVGFPYFGVVGWGLHNAHNNAIQSREDALGRAKAALASWKTALESTDRNYAESDDLSETPIPTGGGLPAAPPLGDLGGGGGPQLASAKMPASSDLDLPHSPGSDLPNGELPGSDLAGTDRPGADIPPADFPEPARPDASRLDLPATDPADTRVRDLDAALNNPSKTDLSQYRPTTPPLTSNLPSPPSVDPPGAATRVGVPSTVVPLGVGSNGAPTGANAAVPRGAAGPGGMPMMPMAPTGAGVAGDQGHREKLVALSEDESVWEGDDDLAPQVIGQEEL